MREQTGNEGVSESDTFEVLGAYDWRKRKYGKLKNNIEFDGG